MSHSASTSSDLIAVTAGTAVTNAGDSGRLRSVICIGGSAAGTVTVYDSVSTAAGTVLVKIAAPIGDTQSVYCDVAYNLGIVVVVTGTASAAIVHTIRG